MSVSSGRDLRAACRLLEQTAGASDDLLTTLYLSTSKIPEMQLRAVALIQNKSLRNLFLIKLDQLLDTKESKTQKNTHLKTINAVLNEQPKNAWLKLKKLRICLSLGTKLGDLTFVQTLEELISSDLNPSLNRQLFLICVEGRKKEEALLLSARLLSLDNTSKNKLWIYNQLQIFGAIPNELKDQLSIFDEPNAINRQDALILDPGYSFQAGHHENSNLAVFEILQSSQHSRVTLICSLNARVSTEVNSLMNVSKTLWTNPYAHNGKQWSARDIEGLNEAFYQDLKQNLVVIPSIIYIHSMRVSMLLGFAKWISEMPIERQLKVVIGVIEFDFLNDPTLAKAGEQAISDAISILNGIGKLEYVIYGETDAGVRLLAKYATQLVLKVPYLAALTASLQASKIEPRTKNGPKSHAKGVFLGGTRLDKGLGGLINVLDKTGPIKFMQWTIQYEPVRLRKIDSYCFQKVNEMAEARKDIKFQTKTLTKKQYDKVLDTADVAILPYSDRYASSGSGILFESVARGIPILISPLPNLIREIELLGGQYEVHNFETDEKFTDKLKQLTETKKQATEFPILSTLRKFLVTQGTI